MKISKQELIEMGACKDGLKRFIKQTGNSDEPVDVASLVGGENTYHDLLWLAGKKLPTDRIVRFACDCAILSIELVKPYTDKYDIIVDFLNNPIEVVYAAAADNTAADNAAACAAANAATYAADAAAYDDPDAAAYAAACAAEAAVDASAGNKDKVDELLIELFSQEGKEE